MIRAVTGFLAPRTVAIDKFFLKLTGGRHTLSELAGWNIVHILMTAAGSGREAKLIVIGIEHEGKLALIASNFGRPHHPKWYFNLLKNPQCKVKVDGGYQPYVAREAEGGEREEYWRMAVEHYAGYELYQRRAAPRPIPILILEPVK